MSEGAIWSFRFPLVLSPNTFFESPSPAWEDEEDRNRVRKFLQILKTDETSDEKFKPEASAAVYEE